MRHLIFLLILTSLLYFSVSLAEEKAGYAVVRETGAILMQATADQEIAHLSPGLWVEILESFDETCLVHTQENGIGYIRTTELHEPDISLHTVGVVTNPDEKEYLNLRAEPSLNAEVLNIYYNGVPCIVDGKQDEEWYQVNVGGNRGYFKAEFLTLHLWPCSTHVVTVHTQSQTGVNLRSGPGYEYPALKMCDAEAYLMVLQTGNEWWMVADGDQVGFIRSAFLYDGILNPFFQDENITGAIAIVSNPDDTQVLNMRAMPTKASESLRQYVNGTRFILLAQGTEWCRVTDGEGNVGFCMTDFLRIVNGQDIPMKRVVHPDGSYVNLRSAPSVVGSRILCEVSDGEMVEIVVPDVNGWAIIRYGNLTGYMSSLFLE